ncbi:universal stress protein [Actinomycetospora atypica]|uniref:Universal stress protein n=1 Tax=Actinomycetospora atypica TaxID=1290095 RepID=A0ABV9YNX1_9PSEU
MTVLVGLSPDARDDAGGALALATRLARAWREDLTVAVVAPAGSSADPVRAALGGVLAGAGVEVTWRTVQGRSVADGLVEAVTGDVSVIVLGSDPDRTGRVAVRVARSSPVPVVLARDAGAASGRTVERVTCAFDGTTASSAVLAAAADLAARSAATLRVVSFAVRRPPAIPPEVGLDAEEPVIAQWSEQVARRQAEALSDLGVEAETAVHAGATWEDAVHAAGWTPGDLLVVGGSAGPATRLFLGDRVRAIVAAAPVPAVIVPSA